MLDYSSPCVAYFKDGSSLAVELTGRDSSIEGTDYLVANYVNRQQGYSSLDLIGYSFYFGTDTNYIYYVSANKCDFYLFQAVNSGYFEVSAVRGYDQYSDFDDYGLVENYSNYSCLSSFDNTGQLYSSFHHTLNYNASDSVIFDYSSLHYDNGGYNAFYLDSIAIRGENISFYNTYFLLDHVPSGDCWISYGSPLYDLANSEYQRGYGAGYSGGWVDGNSNGYQQGINANGNIGTQEATAFSYIGTAFNSVGQLLSIEIIPNITLGLCFSIPLVFTLILTIFKLVRK